MKLPSSSSILLATLAISCSSSSLAAPTGLGDTSPASSSSNHHLSFHRGGHISRGLYSPGKSLKRKSDRVMGRSMDHAEYMKARDLGPLLQPVVEALQAILGKLSSARSANTLDMDSVSYVSSADMDNLKSVINGIAAFVPPDTGARSSSVAPFTPSNSSSVPSSSAPPVAAATPVDVNAAPGNSTSAASSAPTGANPPIVAVPFAVSATRLGPTSSVGPATSSVEPEATPVPAAALAAPAPPAAPPAAPGPAPPAAPVPAAPPNLPVAAPAFPSPNTPPTRR